tara:strand:- start:601 stop:828 length:228 start_codon:yes stop_codon:yes gene_type:complete
MKVKFEVGDLVKLHDVNDKDRDIGIVIALSPRMAHVVSHGRTNVVQVYWPKIQETDWEYDFFLKKLEEPTLTKDK